MIGAWDRAEATRGARKHAAVAEFIRRRPAPGCALEGAAQMPAEWEEFTGDELAQLLAEARGAAEELLDLARDLEVKLPGTKAAFRAGTLRQSKAQIIAWATALLDPGEARAAEDAGAGPGGAADPGRAAVGDRPRGDGGRARRRPASAGSRPRRDARVQRWAEDSGNAALVGRELPPAEVLAADQRITWWAQQLKKAGLDGDMDELRARAYLDLLLDKDSRPRPDAADGSDGTRPAGPGATAGRAERRAGRARRTGRRIRADGGGPGPRPRTAPAGGTPAAACCRPGSPGGCNLTVPLATLLGLADRPGEIPGHRARSTRGWPGTWPAPPPRTPRPPGA